MIFGKDRRLLLRDQNAAGTVGNTAVGMVVVKPPLMAPCSNLYTMDGRCINARADGTFLPSEQEQDRYLRLAGNGSNNLR